MSRAFVKESDAAAGEALAELKLSPHRNLVTERGLALIGERVDRLRSELAAARSADDHAGLARIQRDLRYWNERQRTAELVQPSPPGGRARFGCEVELGKADGGTAAFRIVGEDEANPQDGTISWVSPIARRLLGAAVGDEIALPDGVAVIVAIR